MRLQPVQLLLFSGICVPGLLAEHPVHAASGHPESLHDVGNPQPFRVGLSDLVGLCLGLGRPPRGLAGLRPVGGLHALDARKLAFLAQVRFKFREYPQHLLQEGAPGRPGRVYALVEYFQCRALSFQGGHDAAQIADIARQTVQLLGYETIPFPDHI